MDIDINKKNLEAQESLNSDLPPVKLLSKKKKKSHKIPDNKVVIRSPYKLTDEEIKQLQQQYPEIQNIQAENIVDKDILAGIVINKGTKMLDLSLKGGLQNLKQFIYESS